MERLVVWPARNEERETNRQSGFTIAHRLRSFAYARTDQHRAAHRDKAPLTPSRRSEPEQPMQLAL